MKTIYLKTVCILLVFASTACSAQNRKETDSTISVKVKELIKDATNDEEKAEAIFYFMRDSVKFGWVYPQEIPAEEVLKNRKGVCMQKTNLFVAMAREAGLKARFHFMYVEKKAL